MDNGVMVIADYLCTSNKKQLNIISMYRHIFNGVVKAGISEETIEARLDALQVLKTLPQAKSVTIGRNLQWYTPREVLIVTADFENKSDWEAFVASPEHTALNEVASEVFDLEKSCGYQIEY